MAASGEPQFPKKDRLPQAGSQRVALGKVPNVKKALTASDVGNYYAATEFMADLQCHLQRAAALGLLSVVQSGVGVRHSRAGDLLNGILLRILQLLRRHAMVRMAVDGLRLLFVRALQLIEALKQILTAAPRSRTNCVQQRGNS
jgi:hypothetical protein